MTSLLFSVDLSFWSLRLPFWVLFSSFLTDVSGGVTSSLYSTNFMCVESRCVNPVFPAFRLLDVPVLENQEKRNFKCVKNSKNVKQYSSFCENILDYTFAVPDDNNVLKNPDTDGDQLKSVIKVENRRALEAYISQIDGFGYELADNRQPWDSYNGNPCVYAIWRMACFTYFPKCDGASIAASASFLNEEGRDSSVPAGQKESLFEDGKHEKQFTQETKGEMRSVSLLQLMEKKRKLSEAKLESKSAKKFTTNLGMTSKTGSTFHMSKYLRPCRGSCEAYLSKCAVECCDDGVKCAFEHKERVTASSGVSSNADYVTFKGYIDAPGPSSFCTGEWSSVPNSSSSKSSSPIYILLFIAFFSFVGDIPVPTKGIQVKSGTESKVLFENDSMPDEDLHNEPVLADSLRNSKAEDKEELSVLQIGTHTQTEIEIENLYKKPEDLQRGNNTQSENLALLQTKAKTSTKIDLTGEHLIPYWRRKVDFTRDRQGAIDPVTNTIGFSSCNNPNIPDAYKCSMHGVCVVWNSEESIYDQSGASYMVCKCDKEWAGMECKTKRKKRFTAYVLSLLLGWLGVDRMYMGMYSLGMLKLLSLGGLGVWWIYDIILIGAGDVYAGQYRLAPSTATDIVPPVMTPLVSVIVGFLIAIVFTARHIKYKRLLEAEILRKYGDAI